jgi:hypothetical protein
VPTPTNTPTPTPTTIPTTSSTTIYLPLIKSITVMGTETSKFVPTLAKCSRMLYKGRLLWITTSELGLA